MGSQSWGPNSRMNDYLKLSNVILVNNSFIKLKGHEEQFLGTS